MINTNEAETALIAEVILKPEIFIDCLMADLTPSDFSDSDCKDIYEACLMSFAEDKPIEVISLLYRLPPDKTQHYKQAIVLWAKEVPSTANYKAHIELVRNAARLRRVSTQAKELYESIESNENIEYCREVAANIMRSFDGTDGTEVITARQGYRYFIENIGKDKEYIPTGIEKLDKYVQLSKGDFVVIGGRPSTGKTALTLQIMLKMAEKKNVVFFSLETSSDKLFERMISNYATFDYSNIRKGGLQETEIKQIDKYCNGRFNELNFSVVKAAGWSVEKIKSTAMQLKADVIYIDYLGLISTNSGRSQYEKVTQISLDLHTMAQRENITTVALVQLNRGAGKEAPDMSSLRDSGQIEQDADVILLLSTPDDTDDRQNEKQMTIAKNKDGMTGFIKFNFAGEYQQFRPIETVYDRQEDEQLPFGQGKVFE